jgi:hypothetical protein
LCFLWLLLYQRSIGRRSLATYCSRENVSKTPAQFAHSSFLAANKSLRFPQIQRTNPSNCYYYQIHSQQERKNIEILLEFFSES